jgi:hypothetical protein
MNRKLAVGKIEFFPERSGHFPHTLAAHDLMDESLKKSGALPRLVGRIHPTKPGMYQVPFGALMLERITKLYGPNYEVSVELGDYNNDDMFRMFTIENNANWHNLPISYIEAVHALKIAHRNGDIKVGTKSGNLNPLEIAKYFGGDWIAPDGRAKKRVFWCLRALELMESGDLQIENLYDLGPKQVDELLTEVAQRKVQREKAAQYAERQAEQAKLDREQAADEAAREAAYRRENFQREQAQKHREISKKETKKIIAELGPQLRSHELGTRDVKRKAEEVAPSIVMPKKPPVWLFQAAKQMSTQLGHILAPDDKRYQTIREIIKFREQLDTFSFELLGGALADLAERCNQLVLALGQPQSPRTANANPRKLK